MIITSFLFFMTTGYRTNVFERLEKCLCFVKMKNRPQELTPAGDA